MNTVALSSVALDARMHHMVSVENPSSEIRGGLIIASLFFVAFLGWAAFARLDAAVYAPGTLVVSGQRQTVQHRDGGVVGAIYVREGQRVVKGQLLIQLAAAEVRAEERSLASQAIRLLAVRARLEAEQQGHLQIVTPREFLSLPTEDAGDARLAIKLQEAELTARTSVLESRRDALGQRASQSRNQGRGYIEQTTSAAEQLRLIEEQIAALRPIANEGFVSKTRMRDLERSRAELMGQRGQFSASVAQASGAARESQIQVVEAERTFRERTASDVRDVDDRLGEVMPKWTAARDRLARTAIRAPVTGAVVGLSIFTPEGVVSPGQKLMDIVPEDADLRIQMRIAPDDADDLAVGQRTLIKFSGLHERTLPNLEGRLTRLSADSFVDERTGQSYFTGEIIVPASQVRLIQKVRGSSFGLRAGMPAQILIPLRERTALEYALEPLIGSMWASFREH